jgi:RNA polymerase sigma-70 factor (ECF subfamily)
VIVKTPDPRAAANDSDRELLRRYRSGDMAAFGLVYRRHARFLYLYACSMTRDPAVAEDLLQQAFLKVLLREPASLGESLRGLLSTSLRNLFRDQLKHSEVERRHFPRLCSALPESSGSPGDLETLSWALGRLPPEQREAVLLKTYGGLTFAEIAGVLGEPEPTVKSRYRYALQKLSELVH